MCHRNTTQHVLPFQENVTKQLLYVTQQEKIHISNLIMKANTHLWLLYAVSGKG